MLTAAAYVYTLNSADVPSANAYANIQAGSNGSAWGSSELAVASGGDETDGRTQWDTYNDGRINSGDVAFSFAANATGTSLSVGNSTAGPITTSGISSFSSVTIIAGVQNHASVEIDSLTIFFYDASGNITSQYVALDGPYVNMTNPASDGIGEQGLVVTPPASAGAVAGVSIIGTIKLTAPAGEYPAADDLFGTIAIS